MEAQYLVQIYMGYAESQSVASLSLFLTVEEEWAAQVLASQLRDLFWSATHWRNETIRTRNAEAAKHQVHLSIPSRLLGELPLTPKDYLQLMFDEMNLNGMDEWDLFEENGWNMSTPDTIPITRVISLVNFDLFLETNDSGWELKEFPPYYITDSTLKENI